MVSEFLAAKIRHYGSAWGLGLHSKTRGDSTLPKPLYSGHEDTHTHVLYLAARRLDQHETQYKHHYITKLYLVII